MESAPCYLCEKNEAERPQWGPGPWQDEPHRVEFEHAGLPCILHRNSFGSWCGYVGLAPGHPLHGRHYQAIDLPHGPHGGLTYAEPCAGHICHVPRPGEPDNLWWLGFDCAHAFDFLPATDYHLGAEPGMPGMPGVPEVFGLEEHYWTVEEVRAETARLAETVAAMALEPPRGAPTP